MPFELRPLFVLDSESEPEDFKLAAKLDGFNTVSGWIMFHMRRRKAEVLKSQG